MGCDIHCFVEARIKNVKAVEENLPPGGLRDLNFFGRWHYVGSIDINRNYGLFAALAGVRGSGPAAKGLPADLSDWVRVCAAVDNDCHSHSWATFEAFRTACQDNGASLWQESRERLEAFFEYGVFRSEGVEGREDLCEFRIVFWFDN